MLLFKCRGLLPHNKPAFTFYHCYSSSSSNNSSSRITCHNKNKCVDTTSSTGGYISTTSCSSSSNLYSRLENNNNNNSCNKTIHREYHNYPHYRIKSNIKNKNNNNNIKYNILVGNNSFCTSDKINKNRNNFVHDYKNRSFLTNQLNNITSTIAKHSRTYTTNFDSNYEGDDDYFFDFDIDLNSNNNSSTSSTTTNNNNNNSNNFTTISNIVKHLVPSPYDLTDIKSTKKTNKSSSTKSKKIRVTSKNSEKINSITLDSISINKESTSVNNNNNNNNIQKQQKQQPQRQEQQEQKVELNSSLLVDENQQQQEEENDDQEFFDDQNVFELEHKLTKEQIKIVNLIVDGGKNVFFTGSAGTGKSFVLKHLVSKLRKKYPKSVFVTAATGIAAVNIGGTTLHSFGGIKLGAAPAQRLAVEILQSKKTLQKWLDCKVLIVDEVSMIDSELFEKLDTIGQIVRENNQPFGGIQLVLVGDFFQLPPVYGNYAFESKAWKKSIDVCLELTTVMRQRDLEFIDILNNLRVGKKNDQIVQFLLERCKRPLDITNGVLPTKLYSTNASVDEENSAALEQLPSVAHNFTSYDTGSKELLENLDRDCPAMQKLVLKVGAQVVLLRKLEKHEGLVNGSRGVVVDFVKVRSKKRFSKFYESNPMAPVVQFNDGQKVTIPPSEWGVWSEKKASRVQLPLKLAWALTIHRAQGMTLDKVECELSKSFANGQSYVALSRVKSLEGLHLKDLKKSAIKTSDKVVVFDKKCSRYDS